MERFNFNLSSDNIGNLFFRVNSLENSAICVNQIDRNSAGVYTFTIQTTEPEVLARMIESNIVQHPVSHISRIIFSGPCTILFISNYNSDDTTKTIVRCTESEKFDWKKGAMMALLKYRMHKKDWKDFVERYHEHPKKEAEAAEVLLRYMMGDEQFDSYISWAKETWKECKDDSQK